MLSVRMVEMHIFLGVSSGVLVRCVLLRSSELSIGLASRDTSSLVSSCMSGMGIASSIYGLMSRK